MDPSSKLKSGLSSLGADKATYLNWALGAAAKNPNFNEAVFSPQGENYDYYLSFLNGDTPATNGHLSDIGKMPNHPTFSNESAYAIGRNDAGSWMPSLAALVQPDSFLTAQRQEQAPWQYYNPSRGLMFDNEDAAYAHSQTPGQKLMQLLNGGKR